MAVLALTYWLNNQPNEKVNKYPLQWLLTISRVFWCQIGLNSSSNSHILAKNT